MDPFKLPPTEKEWLEHKDAIWQMYIRKGVSQKVLLSKLKEMGLSALHFFVARRAG
jgi:hypothetical protein